MRSIARFCYEKRWFVVVGWIILLFGLFAISNALGGKYRTEFKLPGSESQAAVDLLKAQGASLDRFGLFTSTIGGQALRIFLDDLTYTAIRPPL